MSSKYIKKYEIPVGFQDLLSEFTKEILRNQPKDIIDFGVEYFKCLQQGLILDYAHKGENIPCDFKPAVPKIPQSLKNLKNPIMESVSQIQKPEKVEPSTQQKEPPSIKIEDEKDVIDKNEIKEKISTKIIAIKQNEEEKKIIKEKVGNILSASEEASKVNKSSPLVTKTLGKTSNYLNCIDFEEKEEVLKKLKENNEIEKEIEEYIDKDFEPNKNINNLVSLLQKTIMAYYNTKGTEKEDEYNKLNEEANDKINEIKDKYPLIDIDLDSIDSKDALSEFKKYEYYPRILKGYLYKLKHLNDENNSLLDEICFFLFVHHLKLITSEEKPGQVLEDKPYIEKYFNHNIQLLSPEIYSFVLGTKYYDEEKTINLFTSFSFRKRELCHKYYIFYHAKNYGRPEKKKAELLEKYLFVSSPLQILEKLNNATNETKSEVFDTITEKIQQNYPSIWKFISRVVNTPIELVKDSFDIYMRFNTIQRDIIINYLNLGDDYKDIHDKLAEVKIDPIESNFASIMEHIYFDLEYVPELNYRNYCIYNNKLFDIPDSAKSFIDNFNNLDEQFDEDKLLKEYEEKNTLIKKGIYIYLLIKNRESSKIEGFLKKLKLIKEKDESESRVFESEQLKENFTLDSDEFIYFKKEYESWKKELSPEILEYFKKENDEQKKEYFLSLNDKPEKIIIYNLLKIENNNTENGDFENILNEYKEFVPE
jgi:hypothetical protein